MLLFWETNSLGHESLIFKPLHSHIGDVRIGNELQSNGYSLSFVRGVNHGKQSSLFHSALRHGARAKSVFMVGIMAGRATSFENIVADQKGSQFHLQYLIYLRRKSSTPLKYLRKEIPLDIFDFFFFFSFCKMELQLGSFNNFIM